jgi:anthranilate synthase component 1
LRHFERLPSTAADTLNVPDFVFMLTGDMFIFDHVAHTIRLVRTVSVPQKADAETVYRRAGRELMNQLARLRPTVAPLAPLRPPTEPRARPRLKSDACLRRACAGPKNIFRRVILFKWFRPVGCRAPCGPIRLDIYRALRRVNPSPYMYFFRDGDTQVIGSSPEMLVRLEDGLAETRPIAGTRPRGATPTMDDRLARELLADPKERAEHLMLVDLARNDLGRVSRSGTVRVSDFMAIERYSHVMHIVSKVTGRLLPGRDAFDLFRAVFPAGTLSGAPKIRAMEIIEELEPTRRGLYGGAVGYFSYTGNMDMAIAIRTILMQKNKVHLQAGAGIVADSVPATEFDETQNKMAALAAALRLAGEKL